MGDTDKHTYRALGESGLVEDEDGNILNASEVDDTDGRQKSDRSSASGSFNYFPELEDKSNPAYWAFYYDPRYCGPSPKAYMEKMAMKYRKEKALAADNSTQLSSASDFESAKKIADSEQKEVLRYGLHPTYRRELTNSLPAPGFMGVANRNGIVIISNEDYSDIGNFYNGLARARKRKTGRYGFVDRLGKEVIPCTWRSAGDFSEYMAGVQDSSRLVGYVDVTGRLAIPCTWEEGWPFHEGLARVQRDRMIGMIDQSGNIVIRCTWLAMGDCSEGLIGVKDTNGKCGYLDKTGRIVIPCEWKQVWTFCEGMAVVQDFNKRLGFIDKSGKLVIPCRWKKANYFKDGLAKVSDSKNFFFKDVWVYIDKNGQIVKKEE